MNKLYFGDCLEVLRDSISDESVDLVYLDPPFKSQRDYNIIFSTPKGHKADAQITAFEDTWHWSAQAEREFNELIHQSNTDVSEVIQSFRAFLRESDIMAYLTMMANRLLALKSVLKPRGSLYLHCDPTASHYLKVILDSVFDPGNFRNEISWQRSQPKSHTSVNFPNCRDILLRYSKSNKVTFNKVFSEYDPDYLRKFYKYTDEDGRRYRLDNLANPNKNRPNLTYELLGVTRVWRWTKERMEKAYQDGRIIQRKPGSVPAYKRYLDEMPGQPVTDNWCDIEHLHGSHSENLGYPTQKPLSLLERIIMVSSNEGDIVLDPFCGCGTAVHAAQKLRRRWIGIDITHLAISLIEKRLNDAFPNIEYEVFGTPKSLAGAQELADRDKYQFQWWACSIINAQPYKGKKKGADTGIDGLIYFQDEKAKTKKIIVSVKGGKNVHRDMIADLKNTVDREKAEIGLFVTLTPPTKPMIKEACSAGFYESPHFSHTEFQKIQILTIEGLLDETEYPKYPDLSAGAWTFKKAQRQDMMIAESSRDLFNGEQREANRE